MSTSKKRSLVFIIIFLLLTNIGVLGYFLWYKKLPKNPSSDKRNGIALALQKDVGFDDQQVAEYRILKEKQWASIKPMFEEMRKAKDSLYRLLSNENANDSLVYATAEVIAQKQKTIDLQAFTHFKQIRALCKPEQLVKYDSLVQRLVRKMGKPRSEQKKEEKK
jgi:protein CpxP